MNAELLLAHYEKIADAPDAIQRLRRFTLDLAVRGKLVPQDPAEEPASELLRRATSDRSRTTLQESRTDKHEATEPGYDLPPRWLWVRIGDHLELINGMAFKPTDWKQSGIKIVRIQNLNRLDAPFNYCDPEDVKDRFLIDDGAFLISWSGTPGTSFGAFIWDRGKAVLNQHIFRCAFRLNAFDQRYLRLAINGRLDEMIAKAHGGVGLQHITKGKLEALLIALPPLAEQHRIVAKVDELMALCDRLEEARAKREATRDRLTAASLARLNAPDPDPATFANHARFALNALPALTSRPEQIKQLRQTILNLAVRGKLAPQDPNDCSVSRVVLNMSATGRRRIREAVVDPFDLPRGWAWRAIDTIADQVTDGEHLTPPRILDQQVPLVTAKNVRDGFMDYAQTDWVSFATAQKAWRRCKPTVGDLLLVCVGATTGRLAVLKKPQEMVLVRSVALIRPNQEVTSEFLERAIRSPVVQQQIWASVKAAAQPCLYINRIQSLLIPVPPVAEQRRIVNKIDELMEVCDQLELNLTSSDDTRRRLLDALIADALTPHERQDKAA